MNNQLQPITVSDGAKGTIIIWVDYRASATSASIYAQRVDSTGAVRWTADGVLIATGANDRYGLAAVMDGSGGVIVSWTDFRNGTSNSDIYAQRISATGAVQWTANGVQVTNVVNNQATVSILPDGVGGAIVAWDDLRSIDYDIYAQRLNSTNGGSLWTANGVAICVVLGNQNVVQTTSDGGNGAIFSWYDSRNGAANYDIFAQKVNATGTVQWAAGGVPVCTAANNQYTPALIPDGAGGAIVTWQDFRNGSHYDIYAQKLSPATGAILWTPATGVPICTAPGDQLNQNMSSDGLGGGFIAWNDPRNGTTNYQVYGQRIDGNGAVQWAANGSQICPQPAGNQFLPKGVSDGAGGTIFTWYDSRATPPPQTPEYDIYAQRVGPTGTLQWTNNGIAVSTAFANQVIPTICSDGAGGSIISWFDSRNTTSFDIYAQRLDQNGRLGIPQVQLSTTVNFPAAPTASTDYRLFGMPGDQASVGGVAVSSLLTGAQRTDWRMFRDNGAAANYLVELSAASMLVHGEGYWLLQKGPLNVNRLVSLPVVDTGGSYTIPLRKGWNIITNPYDRQVTWLSVQQANKRLDTITVAPTPVISDYNGSYTNAANLVPFKGYYFFNDSTRYNLPSLVVPYPVPPGALPKVSAPPISWQLQLVYNSDINVDGENHIGISSVASAHLDRLDARKPPLFLDQGFLYFPRREWDPEYPLFSADYRPELGEGQVWDFEVSNPRKSDATVQVVGIDQVPPEYRIVLVNEQNSTPHDLRVNNAYRYATVGEKMSFKLIVGNEGYVEEQISLMTPATFTLIQNYPNPFNPSTAIGFTVARPAHVRVDVYSLLGQHTATLVDGQLEAGVYTVQWDSKNQAGRQAATGVYFYRLLVDGNLVQARKMLLTK